MRATSFGGAPLLSKICQAISLSSESKALVTDTLFSITGKTVDLQDFEKGMSHNDYNYTINRPSQRSSTPMFCKCQVIHKIDIVHQAQEGEIVLRGRQTVSPEAWFALIGIFEVCNVMHRSQSSVILSASISI